MCSDSQGKIAFYAKQQMSSVYYTKSTSTSPFSSPVDSQNSLNLKLSKSRLIENYLEEHVPQWRDDSLIQSLFANLPNREVKPEAFAQKYSFWKDLLILMTRSRLLSGSVFKFPSKELSGCFKRGGMQPICLNGVIVEMQMQGIAIDSTKDFNCLNEKRSSVIGGVVNWIYDSFKSIISGSTDDSIYDDEDQDEMEALIPAQVLIPSLLIEQKEILCDLLTSLNSSHMPFTFEEFHELVNESRRKADLVEVVEKDDVLLILKFLKYKGFLNYSPVVEVISENVFLAIKIKGAVSSIDLDIVKMKKLHVRLSSQVEELSKKITELTETARKTLLIYNDRKMATYQLKRRALLEKLQNERLNSLHAVDEILLRISSLSDEKLILEAYKTGADALKGLIPNLKDVDGAVDQLQGLIADHDAVSQALNQEIGTSYEFDAELEAELEALTAETENTTNTAAVAVIDGEGDGDINEITRTLGSITVDEVGVKNQQDDEQVPEFA